MRTTLYEKVFINGFQKPSYVVASLALAEPPPEALLTRVIPEVLEAHPRLRSLVRSRFGVPTHFEPLAAAEWLSRGGLVIHPSADLHALEERLLSTPLDLGRTFPLEVHLVRGPAALVVKLHHAIIDGASGFALLHDFARVLSIRPPRREPRQRRAHWPKRLQSWAARAQLRPRLPEVSLVARYRPSAVLEQEPVEYAERVIPGGHRRIAERGRARGATFSEILASALVSAMNDYNRQRTARPPSRVGLMFARAQPRRAEHAASFRADTCLVSLPADLLEQLHHPSTLRQLRAAARDPHHNDVALGLLYVTRRLARPQSVPSEQNGLHFTLSDVTSFGRGLGREGFGLTIRDLRVLASPTSFDHAGMLVSRFGGDVRLSLVAHRGAVESEALFGQLLANLEES